MIITIIKAIFSRPLVPLATGYICGVLIASEHQFDITTAAILILVFFCLSVRFGFLSICLGLFLGVLRCEIMQVKPHNHIEHFSAGYYKFAGTIIQAPFSHRAREQPIDEIGLGQDLSYGHLVMTVEQVFLNQKRVDTVGCARIYLDDAKVEWDRKPSSLEEDDVVLIECFVSEPRAPSNPGQFNHAELLRRRDIYWVGQVKEAHQLRIIKRPLTPRKLLYQLRSHLREKFYTHMDEDSAAFLTALILGFQQGISQELRQTFQKTGTAHLIAISGLHLVIVYNILWVLFSLVRIHGAKQSVIMIASLTIYSLLAGFNAPVVRSLLMISTYIFADVILRRPDSLSSLSLAAILILIINPGDLFEIGFQLSFLAVLGIVVGYRIIYNLIPKARRSFLSEYVRGGIAMSTLSFVFLLPIVSNCFYLQANISILANLLLYPLIFLLMASGFIFLALSFIPLFASAAGWMMGQMLLGVRLMGDILSGLPLAFSYVTPLPAWLTVTFYVLLTIWLLAAMRIQRPAMLISIVVFPLATCNWERFKQGNNFQAVVLDVGEGQCVYLRVKSKDVVFNCGSLTHANPARNVTIPFLVSNGIKRLDYLVLASDSLEHISGVRTLISELGVGELFVPGSFMRSGLIDLATSRGVKVTAIESKMELDGFQITHLLGYLSLKVDKRILLAGTPADSWNDTDLTQDHLIAPMKFHQVEGWEDIVSRVRAKGMILSSGRAPPKKLVEKLNERGIKVYSTHKQGAVSLEFK